MSEYLNINSITDSAVVKSIAKNSNTVTKNNDTIDNWQEWKAFLDGVVSAFCAGNLTYETTTKYINLSSSVFTEQDKYAGHFKSKVLEGVDEHHSKLNSRFSRKIAAFLGTDKHEAYLIMSCAEGSAVAERRKDEEILAQNNQNN